MQFALEEREVVLLDGILNRVVLWIVSLDQNSAGKLAAPRAPRDLRQQLKRPLSRAKIRQAQR
jgi:hypothetical protein